MKKRYLIIGMSIFIFHFAMMIVFSIIALMLMKLGIISPRVSKIGA